MTKFNEKNFTCEECANRYCDKAELKPDVEECYDDVRREESSKKKFPRKTGNAYRRRMNLLKKERRMKIINEYGRYNPTAGYVEWDIIDGVWTPIGKYIKYPKNSNRQKFYKRYSNRIARRNELPTKGNGYRKNFDYWWTLY